jgi:hypothetical protein
VTRCSLFKELPVRAEPTEKVLRLIDRLVPHGEGLGSHRFAEFTFGLVRASLPDLTSHPNASSNGQGRLGFENGR